MIYICLLRGINVGGNKRIKMADLRDLLKTIGIQHAKTILQSGNVVFESDEENQGILINTIETTIQGHYGFEVKVILRTSQQWQTIIDSKPAYSIEVTGSRLLLVCLNSISKPKDISTLTDAKKDEIIHMLDTDIFIYYPNGMSKSKLGNPMLERKLKVTSTARNWNTVLKLQTLIETITN